jgi:hypothetical protein
MSQQAFSYQHASYLIPDEKTTAYREAWRHIASPGNWWTGNERLAIAATVRAATDCPLCLERTTALSPFTVQGQHASAGPEHRLAEPVIDAIHRICTDSARLTGSWVAGLINDRFSYGHYVEMLSVIVTVMSIDSFHQVLGMELEPLPKSQPGEPNHYHPAGAAIDVAWVPMIYPENLTETDADIYFGAPRTGNVIRAMSLVPDAVRMLHTLSAAQYLPTPQVMDMGATGSLTLQRPQTELLAARTSALNDCFY